MLKKTIVSLLACVILFGAVSFVIDGVDSVKEKEANAAAINIKNTQIKENRTAPGIRVRGMKYTNVQACNKYVYNSSQKAFKILTVLGKDKNVTFKNTTKFKDQINIVTSKNASITPFALYIEYRTNGGKWQKLDYSYLADTKAVDVSLELNINKNIKTLEFRYRTAIQVYAGGGTTLRYGTWSNPTKYTITWISNKEFKIK